jgi:hypothetical protein
MASRPPRHKNFNFGLYFRFWDKMLGTYKESVPTCARLSRGGKVSKAVAGAAVAKVLEGDASAAVHKGMPNASGSASASAYAAGAGADVVAAPIDEFDAELVEKMQDATVPKALRFNSPGRKATISIFAEGKRQRKSTTRFVAKN